MEKKISVMIADDHPIVREGIRNLLNQAEKFDVVGEAANGKELLLLLTERRCDVVLLDNQMPVMNGRQTLERIRRQHPKTRVVIISFDNDDLIMKDFIRAGASAYICKSAAPATYIETISAVHESGTYLSDTQNKLFVNDGIHQQLPSSGTSTPLSKTEEDIRILLCAGKTDKEIAQIRHISENTAHSHRGHIYKKTGTKNVPELIKFSLDNGMDL